MPQTPDKPGTSSSVKGKHSPGPWRCSESDGRHWNDVVDARGARVADCYGWADEAGTVDASMANARLIAAAPEMLELLRELEWEGFDYSGANVCPSCNAFRDTAGDARPGFGAHETSCKLAVLLARIEGEG